jgi:hypothetical protein
MTFTPGRILPSGTVVIDEPASIGVTTFADNGEVLLTFHTRPGGNCEQVIIGLSARQALQLIEQLLIHSDACVCAIADGRGGAPFESKP